jgi:hypothetical protein
MVENELIDHGIGEWLILHYLPVSLFSLRMTHATSKGGKTLLVPTPYAFKMTMIDACFRVFEGGEAETKAKQVFDLIKGCEVRFSPPPVCVVQNTFVKIRQEERDAPKGYYVPTIAYREFCFYNNGELKVALGKRGYKEDVVTLLQRIASHINCIGKRGSFWQYAGHTNHNGELPKDYTHTKGKEQISSINHRWSHYLDDFGEALCKDKDGFDRISTYSSGIIQLNKHRVLIKTLIPYCFKQSSRHFTQYEKIQDE